MKGKIFTIIFFILAIVAGLPILAVSADVVSLVPDGATIVALIDNYKKDDVGLSYILRLLKEQKDIEAATPQALHGCFKREPGTRARFKKESDEDLSLQ